MPCAAGRTARGAHGRMSSVPGEVEDGGLRFAGDNWYSMAGATGYAVAACISASPSEVTLLTAIGKAECVQRPDMLRVRYRLPEPHAPSRDLPVITTVDKSMRVRRRLPRSSARNTQPPPWRTSIGTAECATACRTPRAPQTVRTSLSPVRLPLHAKAGAPASADAPAPLSCRTVRTICPCCPGRLCARRRCCSCPP